MKMYDEEKMVLMKEWYHMIDTTADGIKEKGKKKERHGASKDRRGSLGMDQFMLRETDGMHDDETVHKFISDDDAGPPGGRQAESYNEDNLKHLSMEIDLLHNENNSLRQVLRKYQQSQSSSPNGNNRFRSPPKKQYIGNGAELNITDSSISPIKIQRDDPNKLDQNVSMDYVNMLYIQSVSIEMMLREKTIK